MGPLILQHAISMGGCNNARGIDSFRKRKNPANSLENAGFSSIGPAGFEPTTSTTLRLKHTDSGPTKTKEKREIRILLHQRLHLESIAAQLREQLSPDELRDLIALLSYK